MDKDQYLEQLAVCLSDHPRLHEIVAEWSNHIDEKKREFICAGEDEADAQRKVLLQLDHPEIVASYYSQPSLWSPSTTFGLCQAMNFIIILSGLILTALHAYFPRPVIVSIWDFLVQWKWLLLFTYSTAPGFVGFWLGDRFGVNARKAMEQHRFVWFPNFVLMYSVLFLSPVSQWFTPLLTNEFVLVCSVATILFMPMLRWGMKQGVAHL
ncbi:MAG TPA: hypothetical protein VJ824_07250 [Bacillota bacterium]|nr:hypothetical protein [Bacillota bacterium]